MNNISANQQLARIRWGTASLALSAILFVAFPLIRPWFDLVASDPLGAAREVSSTGWSLSHILLIGAFVFLVFGLLALYKYLAQSRVERRAFIGLVLSIAGIGLVLPIGGVEAFAQPAIGMTALQHGAEVLLASRAIYMGPGALAMLLGLVLLTSGAIFFAIAIWQSGLLPRYAGIPFALGMALFLPLLPAPIRIFDGLLIGVSGLWIAWSMWRNLSTTTMGEMQSKFSQKGIE